MAQLVQAPRRQPRLGGIKDVVGEFVEESRLAVAEIAWEDSGCGMPKPTRAGCYDLDVDPEDKTFDGVSRYGAVSAAFAAYAGVECWLGGDADGSYTQQAQTLLEQGEDRTVEAKLWAWAAAVPDAVSAGTILQVIAKLEQEADANYVGRPVLMMSRASAAHALQEGALVRDNGKIVSAQGTPVIASGAIEDGDEPFAAIIGQPAVYASPVRSVGVQEHTANLGTAIAERVYAIGVDCDYRLAGTVDPTP